MERIRANAIAATDYVTFARDNFGASNDVQKLEIAHALGVKYVFYGRGKKIALELHSLMIETVKFVKELQSVLRLSEVPSTSKVADDYTAVLFDGGAPSSGLELLPMQTPCWPKYGYATSSQFQMYLNLCTHRIINR